MSSVPPVDPNSPKENHVLKDLGNTHRISREDIKPAEDSASSLSPDRDVIAASFNRMLQIIDIKKERKDFLRKVKEFSQPSAESPLLPSDPRHTSEKDLTELYEDFPTDIYFYGGLVLKPGQHEVRMALLVDKVASLLGMSEVVPAASEIKVSHLVASKDFDWSKGEMRMYDIDERDCLVTSIDESEDESEEEIDQVEDEGDDTFVRRHSARFKLKNSGNNDQFLEVIGNDVLCMAQQCFKKDRLFTGKLQLSEVDGKLSPKTEREAFYNRINFRTFFDAFMIITLFNPEDAKVSNLKDSNVLFEAIGKGSVDKAPLAVRLIDTAEFGSDRPVPRNGLMGFPQAREEIKGKEKEYVLNKLREVREKKNELIALFKEALDDNFEPGTLEESRNKDHLSAFELRIEAIGAFVDNPPENLTLESLFFAVYPEYHNLWNLFTREGRNSPQFRAGLLGFATSRSEIERFI